MEIGFIGLGAMGRGMAASLQNAGHDLVVNDLRKESAADCLGRGGSWAETSHELASRAELILTSLPTSRDVEAVVRGDDGVAELAEEDIPAVLAQHVELPTTFA